VRIEIQYGEVGGKESVIFQVGNRNCLLLKYRNLNAQELQLF
jgi:hypothetical protein